MKKIAIISLLSICIAAPALADNTDKPYVAVDLGSATYSNVSPFPNPGMIRIAGGYHFNKYLAGEIGYTKFGDSTFIATGGSATLTASAFQIAAVGSYPLNEQFDLLGKLGITSNKASANNTLGMSINSSESSVLYGVGAQYHFNSQISVRAQYENYGKFENVSSPMEASTISLGLVFNFL
jgi:OOP family OmpA-OmpF porin